MNDKVKLIVFTLVISIIFGLNTNAAVQNTVSTVQPNLTVQQTTDVDYVLTNSLDIVANPTKYLNKKVKIKAKFDKFSTLGLDYKPAYKSSEKYITFLIKRNDVINHTVPLSEMKNFLERKTAEEYIDLKPDDDIEYCGTVFSDALGDAWISVEKFKLLEETSKDTSSK